nr:reverse transcriptase domain-containing protein [Tanacetum cinerariifolium]
MSKSVNHVPTPNGYVVRNTAEKGSKQTLDGPPGFVPDVDLREFCDKHYDQLLPLMAEKHARAWRTSRDPNRQRKKARSLIRSYVTCSSKRRSARPSEKLLNRRQSGAVGHADLVHMFNSTLIGEARPWFDELPPEIIDNFVELQKVFLAKFLLQKKDIKVPVEIHHIKQMEGELTEAFMNHFKAESLHVKRAP